MGCHFLLQCMKVKSESRVTQLCLTLSDPMDCSPPGSSIHEIFQAGVLEWVAIDTKINLKWIKDLNVRPEAIKLLEENIGKTLSDINHSRILYDPLPRMEIKAKISKWDLIKLKSFCTMKETVSKVKRETSEWEKIIANEASDKELISKIYKQLRQLNTRKINDPIKK